MDEPLQRALKNFRDEKCPPHVLEKIQRRVAAETARVSPRLRFRVALGGFAALLTLAFSIILLHRTEQKTDLANVTTSGEPSAQQIISETQIALASIGRVLITAGQSGEQILSEQLLPPIQGSLQTIKNKLEN